MYYQRACWSGCLVSKSLRTNRCWLSFGVRSLYGHWFPCMSVMVLIENDGSDTRNIIMDYLMAVPRWSTIVNSVLSESMNQSHSRCKTEIGPVSFYGHLTHVPLSGHMSRLLGSWLRIVWVIGLPAGSVDNRVYSGKVMLGHHGLHFLVMWKWIWQFCFAR